MAKRRLALLTWLLLLVATAAGAEEMRVLELEGGGQIRYTFQTHSAEAHRLDPSVELAPTDAFNTAILVTRHLAAGRIEEASLLSNAPKARYERLRESLAGWTEADFVRAYGRYFDPGSRILGKATIGKHHLLMWYLKDNDYLTGYFIVDVEGKFLLDDIPSEARSQLRQVLEAHRAGRAN
jgi:hypothetical protein